MTNVLRYFDPAFRKQQYSFLRKVNFWPSVWLTDIFSIPLTLFFSKFSFITPNIISLLSLFVFVAGVFVLFKKLSILSVFLFWVSYILDDCDGQLARLKNKTTKIGHLIDVLSDGFKYTFCMLLIATAIAIKNNNPYIILIVLPYIVFLSVTLFNDFISGKNTVENVEKNELLIQDVNWKKFCDKNGTYYYFLYSDIETLYITIATLAVLCPNPEWILLFGIYIRFIPNSLKKFLARMVFIKR